LQIFSRNLVRFLILSKSATFILGQFLRDFPLAGIRAISEVLSFAHQSEGISSRIEVENSTPVPGKKMENRARVLAGVWRSGGAF
jgi:hypothetical protein